MKKNNVCKLKNEEIRVTFNENRPAIISVVNIIRGIDSKFSMVSLMELNV